MESYRGSSRFYNWGGIVAVVVFAILINSTVVNAETKKKPVDPNQDPRGPVELVVCSQNLNNYGSPNGTAARLGISPSEFQEKENAIVTRIAKTHCDVVALQEVLARNEEDGKKILKNLAEKLRERTGRFYEPAIGTSTEPSLRNGYLVAKDRAEITNTLSYSKVELPRLAADQKPRLFTRGPLEMQITVKAVGDGKPRTVTLINLHFKSKAGSMGDPTGLEWETYRMEMAEGLRRIIENRHKRALTSAESPLIVLGDRNANFDLASAKILEGALSLQDFQTEGGCRLSKRGVPICKPGVRSAQILYSVLTTDPKMKQQPGTFVYKKVFSWIDDILLPAEALPLAWKEFDVSGRYDSGVVSEPEAASDHSLIYVKLNW